MSSTEESTTFGEDTGAGAGTEDVPPGGAGEESFADVVKETDPAIYLALAFIVLVFMYYLSYRRNKRKQLAREAFFIDVDGDKFNISLPSAVEEYYDVKEKCLKMGWQPGMPPKSPQEAANGPARILAQALMKRCIADIPLVTHIQKESAGMNKLYSQSMCSVKQWKTYQAAEALVSAEVDEVRAEADEIEPGWSQGIWRQAMQYHNMLKNKHEMEAKARTAAAALKLKAEEEAKKPKLSPEEIAQKKAEDAERIAAELIREEDEKASKKKKVKKH